jgi:hypothetical protein
VLAGASRHADTDHSKRADTLFVELAVRERKQLVTFDAKLWRPSRTSRFVPVRLSRVQIGHRTSAFSCGGP